MKYLDPEWTKELLMEKQMTNRERAEEISFETGSAEFDSDQRRQLQQAIERALDEAEKRGRMENPPYSVGFKDGQRDMRERAAQVAEFATYGPIDKLHQNQIKITGDIRALPIEGE